MSSEAKIIVNLSRESVVCERMTIASSPLRRMRGLLGRRTLPQGEGMLLTPAPSIHTAFMRFPIDAVFLDRTLRVVKLDANLPPWRMASARHARVVLELAAGEAQRRGVTVGDQLGVVAVGDRPLPATTDSDALEGREPRTNAQLPARQELELRGDTATGRVTSAPGVLRVLLVSSDRRFRAVAATLLVRRGCEITVADREADLVAAAERNGADVVLIDAGTRILVGAREAAAIREGRPDLGVVVVADDARQQLFSAAVLPKWESFVALFDAIESARPVGMSGPKADVRR